MDTCFVVKDGAGQKLAYFYYEDEAGRRSAAKLLIKDEARRIAVHIAKSVTEKDALRLPTDNRKAESKTLLNSAYGAAAS